MVGSSVGPYQILEKLGSGGMGEVFLCHDSRLQRKVALKRLTIGQPGAEDEASILREARAAARLTHPHIASVYDVLEHDGRAFIVMEYVEGESLRARLQHGPMKADQVIGIGRQLASALAAAHAQGVIHRDLKPSNVQVMPDGTIKVLDFGVAKVMPRLDTTVDVPTTKRSMHERSDSPGTLVYMAPEQLVGGRVDVRSDVYSLGVVLFEMATGRRPFVETDAVALAVAMSTSPAPPADAIDPRVPRGLSAVMAKALQREPLNRYQSVQELSTALDELVEPTTRGVVPAVLPGRRLRVWLVAMAAVLVGALLSASLWSRRPAAPVPAATQQRIVVAVLPLENLSGDPSNDFLGAGVAETLTMALSKVPTLTVLSRSEVQDVLRGTRDIRKIATDLDASFVVDGSVQQSADRLRVTLRLVRPDGTVAWSDVYEDSPAAVFALHRTMAADIVDKVQGRLPNQIDLTIPSTSNVEALTAYWQGRAALDRAVSQADFAAAASTFRRAIALDNGFALGYAGLAETLWQQYQVAHDQALPNQALEAGLTALKLDPNQPATRVAVATVYQGMGQYDAAADHVRRAIELQPSNDDAHRILSRILSAQGKPDEAIRELQEAIAYKPRRWTNYSELGRTYFQLRRLPDAVAAFQRALDVLPNDPRTYASLGAIYLEMGDTERALDALERSNKIAPTGLSLSNTGTAYYRLGRFDDAARAYAAALAIDPNSLMSHGNLGDAYLRLNRTSDAKREFSEARTLGLQALRVNDKDARTLSRVAAFEAKLGMSSEAVAHAAQAVALSARDPDIQYKQAVVFAIVGNRAEALEALKRALALGFKAAVVKADYDLAAVQGSAEFEAIVANHP